MTFKRVFGIVTDSVGIGEASDAKDFGDVGADTLGTLVTFTRATLRCRTCRKWDSQTFAQKTRLRGFR